MMAGRPMMGGMGGGSSMMGTMAAVAGGSIIGHGISRALFGGHNSGQPAPTAQEIQQESQELRQNYGQGPCGVQIQSFGKCLEHNEVEPQQCKWAWDMFTQCKEQNRLA